ncbi:hypothetical protein Taro_015085 [Colocasia esculenta]|uniref:Pseudouridine synthase RsuA/RluA-like domain-containing protein n=1 Tax=Colocasia esculenta TaxID=4460 RepID=A0A843UAM2_COLES|nr:hypothetical protein [Colocasia esculenta]
MATSDAEPPPPPRNTFGVPWPAVNDGILYTDVVKSTNSAATVIQFYSSKYSSSAPLQGWLQRIRNGQITVDGQVVTDPETTLRVGSVLVYHRLPWEEPYAPHVLEVLYEDDDIVTLNKPSGLQVLPGGLFQQRTVLRQLQWRACNTISSSHMFGTLLSEEFHPSPVHRLGRGTSALDFEIKEMSKCAIECTSLSLIAFVYQAYYFVLRQSMQKLTLHPILLMVPRLSGKPGPMMLSSFNLSEELIIELGICRLGVEDLKVHMDAVVTRKISKLYRALVTGIIEVDEVVIEQPIGVIHYPGVSKGLYVASSSGKPALSKVKVLERDTERNQTLVQVLVFVVFSLLRVMIMIGDPLYVTGGIPKSFQSESGEHSFAEDGGYRKPVTPVPGDCGYYLHAHKLVFFHPSKHEEHLRLFDSTEQLTRWFNRQLKSLLHLQEFFKCKENQIRSFLLNVYDCCDYFSLPV